MTSTSNAATSSSATSNNATSDAATSTDRSTEQISVALEYVQGKRRVERVLEAATALLARYATVREPEARWQAVHELIRRNFSADAQVVFRGVRLGPQLPEPRADVSVFELALHDPEGAAGYFRARYQNTNPLLLTGNEWRDALRLLVGTAALAAGGHTR